MWGPRKNLWLLLGSSKMMGPLKVRVGPGMLPESKHAWRQ